jgi:squalene-associated FAD-dependent desaturase
MTYHDRKHSNPSVAVIGGGLAGLSAAVAAVENGLTVELFEARRRLGGRASSFRDAESGRMVDLCQHVSMGCCTNLADFCRRTEVADCFRRERRLHFIGPNGKQYAFSAARLLPAPLHLGLAFYRLGYLGHGDHWRIGKCLARLARTDVSATGSDTTIGQWLAREGQSARAIERFWEVVLVSALGDTLDRASLAAAKKVFCDGFLGSRVAYELRLPRVPLDEIFNRRTATWLVERGVKVHTGCRIKRIEGDATGVRGVVLPDGSLQPFDFVVLAVPWRPVCSLLPEKMLALRSVLEQVDRIQPSPISAIHFWFDRPITRLAHAALVGRTAQWVFAPLHGSAEAGASPSSGYVQVVISGPQGVAGRAQHDVVDEVHAELAEIWPVVRRARLLRWRMVTQAEAVFSVRPDADQFRPSQATAIDNLMLAGDWTSTGWPATMEGAVRSGYLAVEAILARMGGSRHLLADDLPRGLLARLLIRA